MSHRLGGPAILFGDALPRRDGNARLLLHGDRDAKVWHEALVSNARDGAFIGPDELCKIALRTSAFDGALEKIVGLTHRGQYLDYKQPCQEANAAAALRTRRPLRSRVMVARQETGFQVRLKEAITEAGLNKARLEKLIGTSGGYVSKLLKGVLAEGRVSTEIGKAIADFLGVNFMWLFFKQGPKRSAAQLSEAHDVSPREASKAAARFFGMPQHIVDAMQAKYASTSYDKNRDAMWWMREYERAIAREKARFEHTQRLRAKAAEPAPAEPPPASSAPASQRARRRRVASG